MKNIINLISGQTRAQAIQEHGVEYGTELWHKRCTGDTTARAMQLLAAAMLHQGKVFEVFKFSKLPKHKVESTSIIHKCQDLVQSLGLTGFTIDTSSGTVSCNVFAEVID